MIKQSSWGWTVQEQLEKNKQLKLSDLKELQTWMKKEEHLPTIPEEQIVLFHHACEYEIEKTKETIEKCYTMRTNSKDIFANRDPLHKFVQEITKVVICTPLAGFDKDGNQVIWMKLLDKDPDKYYYGVSIKQVIMVMDAVQLEYGPVPGYVFVVDGKGYTLSHMLRSSLSLCKKFITYSQEGSTFFPKAMYLLNVSTILEKAISLVKPFMKSDLFSVISFHKPGKFDEIHKQIPEHIIPDEYGGSGGPIAEIHEEYLKKMLKYTDWFKEEEKLRIDESKRKGGKGSGKKAEKEKTHEAEHLSLRTLDID